MRKVFICVLIIMSFVFCVNAQYRYVRDIYESGTRTIEFDYIRGKVSNINIPESNETIEFKYDGNTCITYHNSTAVDKKVVLEDDDVVARIQQYSLTAKDGYKSVYTLYGEYLSSVASIVETFNYGGKEQKIYSLFERDNDGDVKKIERAGTNGFEDEIKFSYLGKEYKRTNIDVVNFALSRVVGGAIYVLWNVGFDSVYVNSYEKLPKKIVYKEKGKTVKIIELSYDFDENGYVVSLEVNLKDNIKNTTIFKGYVVNYYKN